MTGDAIDGNNYLARDLQNYKNARTGHYTLAFDAVRGRRVSPQILNRARCKEVDCSARLLDNHNGYVPSGVRRVLIDTVVEERLSRERDMLRDTIDDALGQCGKARGSYSDKQRGAETQLINYRQSVLDAYAMHGTDPLRQLLDGAAVEQRTLSRTEDCLIRAATNTLREKRKVFAMEKFAGRDFSADDLARVLFNRYPVFRSIPPNDLCTSFFESLGWTIPQDRIVRPKHVRPTDIAYCTDIRIPDQVYVFLPPAPRSPPIVRAATQMHELGHFVVYSSVHSDTPFADTLFELYEGEAFSILCERMTFHQEVLQHARGLQKGVRGSCAVARMSERCVAMNAYNSLRSLIGSKVQRLFWSDAENGAEALSRATRMYQETWRDATGGMPDAIDVLFEIDLDAPFIYSYTLAEFVAWQMKQHLVSQFGMQWHMKKEAGDYLRSHFGGGRGFLKRMGIFPVNIPERTLEKFLWV